MYIRLYYCVVKGFIVYVHMLCNESSRLSARKKLFFCKKYLFNDFFSKEIVDSVENRQIPSSSYIIWNAYTFIFSTRHPWPFTKQYVFIYNSQKRLILFMEIKLYTYNNIIGLYAVMPNITSTCSYIF